MNSIIIQILWLIILLIGGGLLIFLPGKHEKIKTIASILGICTCLAAIFLSPLSAQPRISGFLELPFRITGICLTCAGVSFVTYCGKSLYKRAEFNPTTIREGSPRRIITTGLYAHMRNPLYTGVILLSIGWSLVWLAVYTLFLFPPILVIALYITAKRLEGPRLLQLFGKEFEEYAKKVPAFFPLYLKAFLIALIIAVITYTVAGLIPVD